MRTPRYIFLSVLILFFLGVTIGAYSQTALQFVAITPCRVVDTRNPDGQFGGPPIQGGIEVRRLPIAARRLQHPHYRRRLFAQRHRRS